MSRDITHGGSDWGFTKSLWAPTEKRGGGRWPFWDLLASVRAGDAIVHLRGKGKQAAFVGYSVATGDGQITGERPPDAGPWGYANKFYRVRLGNHVAFEDPLILTDVFRQKDTALRTYFAGNKALPSRELLFYVIQAGRLQCLNGAYLSAFGAALSDMIFGDGNDESGAQLSKPVDRTKTGEQLRELRTRIGQSAFSSEVRKNYGHRCCFPGCSINDAVLLVGAHIARWADAEHLRGQTSNGLCLCLFHDKAFELGLFTLTDDFRIVPNGARIQGNEWALANIAPLDGQQLTLGSIAPSAEALRLHRARHVEF